jgi:hypothetical protein
LEGFSERPGRISEKNNKLESAILKSNNGFIKKFPLLEIILLLPIPVRKSNLKTFTSPAFSVKFLKDFIK